MTCVISLNEIKALPLVICLSDNSELHFYHKNYYMSGFNGVHSIHCNPTDDMTYDKMTSRTSMSLWS